MRLCVCVRASVCTCVCVCACACERACSCVIGAYTALFLEHCLLSPDERKTKKKSKGSEYEMVSPVIKKNTLKTTLPSESLGISPRGHDEDLMKVDVVIEQPRKSDSFTKSDSPLQPVQGKRL